MKSYMHPILDNRGMDDHLFPKDWNRQSEIIRRDNMKI